MEAEKKEKIAAKLKKIKELAERGVGGEKTDALRLYEELKARYDIEDAEILEDRVETHWFSYKTEIEEDLLTQIFFKVTGSASYRRYVGKVSRRKKRGCDCTELEAVEINLLFQFYREELKRELGAFMIAFKSGNRLYPDKTARCYQDHKGNWNELSEEEKRMQRKAAYWEMGMDKRRPPRALLGEMEEDEE